MNAKMLTNIMGSMGRNGDAMVAHVTPGDVVIPRDVVLDNPEFLTKFKKAMADQGGDYRTHIVGSGHESVNPDTGAPEFGWGGNIWKILSHPARQAIHGISKGNMADVAMSPGTGIFPIADKMVGGWLGASPSVTGEQPAGGSPSSDLGGVDQPFKPTRGNEPTKPFDLFARDIGGQTFGSLDPTQQRSYLATQGTQGAGLGDEDKNYYLGLLRRNLIDESGNLGNMDQSLLPVERNYLSRLGLPTDNTMDFFRALQS